MVLDCAIREDGYAFHGIFLDKIFYICGDSQYNTQKKVFIPGKKYAVYTIAGNGLVTLDGTQVLLTANTFIHFVPTTSFSYRSDGDLWEFWWFEYTGLDLAPPNTIGLAAKSSPISFLLEHIFRYGQEGAWDVACGMFITLCALLDYSALLHHPAQDGSGLFCAMDKYIRDNLQTVTVADLVDNFKIEARSLRNFFHREIHIPPKQYIVKLRLEQACRLMLNSKKSLQTIAMETGFSSAYHLSNCFKQQFSISPSQYRRKR